jgi:SOS-response transcriptional repressor LexA
MSKAELRFGVALKEYRERAQMSQEELALESELDRTYISMLERNVKSPTLTTLSKISSALKIKTSDLMFLAEHWESSSSKKEKIRLPFMGTSVSCGLALVHDYKIEKEAQLEDFIVKNPKKTFFVKASGDSMSPTIIDGDVLVIEATSKAKSDDIVLIRIGNDFTIKRLVKTEKLIRFLPDNIQYKELDHSVENPALVLGIVVGFTRNLT